MGNKVNCIHEINFIDLFHRLQDQGNYKNKTESRNMGS